MHYIKRLLALSLVEILIGIYPENSFNMNGSNRFFVSVLLLSSLLVCGCAVQLISTYDSQTERYITDFQSKADIFLETLIAADNTPDCSYDKNIAKHRELKTILTSLLVRAEAIQDNEKTVEQVKELEKIRSSLETTHKERMTQESPCIPPTYLEADRKAINSSVTAMLRLELAKKLGE